MKKLLLWLALATAAFGQTNVQKGAGNVISNGALVIGNSNSLTATGTGNITATVAPAGTLTGATLASNVLASSLTSVGTLTGGATGTGFTVALGTSTITGLLVGANGGTGVANTGKTITIGGNLTTSGAFTTTLTATANTTLTMPVTGTLATLAGSEAFTNKTYNGNTWTAGTGTLTLGAGKTVTQSNTITYTGTDGSTVAFGAGGTVLYSGGSYVASLAGTTNQIAVSGATGAVTLSIPSAFIAPGSIAATTGVSGTTATFSSLTSGRVPFATTAGLLTDDTDMTFATDTLTVTKATIGGISHIANAITSANSVTSVSLSNFTLGTGTFGTFLTATSATGELVNSISANAVNLTITNTSGTTGPILELIRNGVTLDFYIGGASGGAQIGTTGAVPLQFYTNNGSPIMTLNGTGSFAAWGTTGKGFARNAQTYTDSSSATGTVATVVVNSFAQPTVATSNTSVAYTDGATVYIAGGLSSGTNSPSFTNNWGLWNAGATRLDGIVKATATTNSTNSTNGSVLIGNGSAATNVAIGGGNIFAGGSINATGVIKALTSANAEVNISTSASTGAGGHVTLDSTSMTGGKAFYLTSTGTTDAAGAGVFVLDVGGVGNAWRVTGSTLATQLLGNLTVSGATLTTLGGATFHTTSTALTNGAGVGAGTLLTAPSAGNPTKWIGINDNGTTRYIPAW